MQLIASPTKYHYKNIVRWDTLLQNKHVKSSQSIPGFQLITLHLHEAFSKSNKEKYILNLCLELISGQSPSTRINRLGTYKIQLTSRPLKASIHSQVTLRNKNLFNFLDQFLLSGAIQNTGDLTFIKDLPSSSNQMSFYYSHTFHFPSIKPLQTSVYKLSPLQVHILTRGLSPQSFIKHFQFGL